MFTKFFRVDSAMTREIGGTGLGLSICKTIIELLGGRDRRREHARRGLDVLVHAAGRSRRDGAHADARRDPTDPPAARCSSSTAMIEVAELIGTYLARHGYDVVKAHTADEALVAALSLQARRHHARRHPRRGRRVRPAPAAQGQPGHRRHPGRRPLDRVRRGPQLPASAQRTTSRSRSTRAGCSSMIDDIVGAIDSPVALVVDDDRDIVKLLSETLRRKGFAVASAYDGAEALAVARAAHPRHHRDRPQDAEDGRLRGHPAREDHARVGRHPHRRDDRAPHRSRARSDSSTWPRTCSTSRITLEGIASEVEAVLVGRTTEVHS